MSEILWKAPMQEKALTPDLCFRKTDMGPQGRMASRGPSWKQNGQLGENTPGDAGSP